MPLSLHARRATAVGVALLAAAARPVTAQPITDPVDDFLGTYTGPHDPALDVTTAQVFYTGTNFIFRSTSNGPIAGGPATELFVWGVNRGNGTSPGGAFAPDIKFDAVVSVAPFGTTRVVRQNGGGTTILPASAVTFFGNFLQVIVPASALPSTAPGFGPLDFGVNLWPRNAGGGDPVIADFAPDRTNFAVTATPEPATALLLAPALLGIGALRRRRARATDAWPTRDRRVTGA